MIKKTAFFERHEKLGARLVDFSGWMLPVQYEGVLAEHKHCRESVVVFDTSHMGQLHIQGADAAQALSEICTQNASVLKVGRCKYGFLLNENAGILDDTILMRLAADEFLLVVNCGTQKRDFQWIQSLLPEHVVVVNLTDDGWAKIDIQGPESFEILSRLSDNHLSSLKFFGVSRMKVAGKECIVSRTGYTGELGYEIMGPGLVLPPVFDEIMADDRVMPAGLGARDSLRLEMCYPLYGHELAEDINPLEAGLGMFLNLKREFMGSVKLNEVAKAGVDRKLVAFQAESRRRPNPDNPVLYKGEPVGKVTSGAFCPSLSVSAGMGFVRPDLVEPGTVLEIDTGRAKLPVVVTEKPLYKEGTSRKKI